MGEMIFLQDNGGLITADSIPDLDEWFWQGGWNDTRWNCSDWISWHKANKRKYGKNTADQKFSKWWNKQTMGASALDCRTTDSAFRSYIERNGLYGVVWEGAGVFENVLSPIGAGGDIVTGVSKGLGKFGRAFPWVIGGLVIGGVTLGGIALYKYAKR